MKIKLKKKVGSKWVLPTVKELTGKTLMGYISDCFEPCAAAVYSEKETKPYLLISNTEEIFQFYDDLTLKILAKDLANLVDYSIGIKIAMILDEESEYYEARTISPPVEC